MEDGIEAIYDELDAIYDEKRQLKRDQKLLAQRWNTAIDPEEAEWEDRAWMRDETYGELTSVEERVRELQGIETDLEAELEILEDIVEINLRES